MDMASGGEPVLATPPYTMRGRQQGGADSRMDFVTSDFARLFFDGRLAHQ